MMLKDTLLYLARNQRVHDFVIQNRATRGVSRRFVAGETLDEAIQAARVLNQRGIQAALDLLGENVSDTTEAQAEARAYIAAIDSIEQSGVEANISIKLTALGLDISQALCAENLRMILEHAQARNSFVCIDMEGSAYTERTIDMTLRMHQEFPHVGTVIQSYLHRSKHDLEQLLAQGVRVRLVKGAYKEPPTVAFQEKSEVDSNYRQLMAMQLARGTFPAIATHDGTMIHAARRFVRNHGISNSAFEFQMLYGVRRDLQEQLVMEGYHVRVYVPYGSQWYPYLVRRMAERPANLVFVMRNALR